MVEEAKRQVSADRRLMKMGGSLVVAVPNEVVEQWNLKKGDEVRFTFQEGAMKIEPKGTTRVETIPEETVEAYSKAMKGIQARITMDEDARAIHVEFSGENKEVTDLFVRNLWRNLPVFLRLLGLGSVEEVAKERRQK
jgi:antitoxin component of MazEF toxin-antitoxin module